jgi:hypothetical protein
LDASTRCVHAIPFLSAKIQAIDGLFFDELRHRGLLKKAHLRKKG